MKTQYLLNKITLLMITALLAGLFAPVAEAQEEESMILSMTEFVIKPGHNTQFREGVKAWKKCYIEHEGEWTWNMWSRVQGEGTVYGLTSFMQNWAEMDDMSDEAGQACQNLAVNLINPNIEKATSNMARTIPSMSKAPGDSMDVISVMYWRVKNGSLFMETVNEVNSTMSNLEGEPRGYWYYGVGGDLNAPHYFVVTPYENFAAMDVDRDSPWEVVESEHGADKRAELQSNYREAVDQSWSFMYRRVADLSNTGTE